MLAGGKYELAGVAAENQEWRTYEAREVPAGRAVFVHQILEPPSQDHAVSLKDLAGRCTPGSGGVLERFASEGVDYIVTEASEVFRDLRAALERAAALPAPAPEESGEDRFTRVGAWRVPGSVAAHPPPIRQPEPAPAVADRSLTVAALKATEPRASASGLSADLPDTAGEFTRMFQAPVQPSPTTAPPVASQPGGFTSMFQTPAAGQPPPPPAPPVSSKPGEFTGMFQAQTPAQGMPSASPPPVSSEPGTFTRMFQAPASASPAPPPPPQATSKPGEFTQFFQSSLGSAPYEESRTPVTPHVVTPPAAPPPGEYTRLFQMPAQQPSSTPAGSGATNVFVTPPVHSPQPAVPIEEGPSDFTRMIQHQPQPPAEARPAEAPKNVAPTPAAAPGMPFVLIVLFTALAVLAIGMVLFFALRH
jgi:hypothetical protein